MQPAHTKQLVETFPDIFDRMLLQNGFGCQDGWFDLLLELGHSLRHYRSRTLGAQKPVITSVTQELGALKITALYTDPGARKLIDGAEETSRTICELDGNPAAGCYGCPPAWIRPLCSGCADMHGCMRVDGYSAHRDQPRTHREPLSGQEQYAL